MAALQVFFSRAIFAEMMAKELIYDERMRYVYVYAQNEDELLDSFSLRLQPTELSMTCFPIFGTR